jgi:hypothetical protein
MIEKIYSNKTSGVLLHMVIRTSDSELGRSDLVEESQFLQAAIINQPKGKSFKPHLHLVKGVPGSAITQESWICLKGKVRCIYYDVDGSFICESIISQGDLSITLYGGHNYEMLEDSLVIEIKNGPYNGRITDKSMIDA